MRRAIVSAILALAFINSADASLASDEGQESYYQDSHSPGTKGWYWYEQLPPKEEPAEPEKKPEPPKAENKDERNIDLKKYTNRQLWNMHPDDFKKLYDIAEKKAIQTLTPDDVYQTKRMRDIARRKAYAFAAVDSYVNTQHPELSTEDAIPASSPGRSTQFKARTEAVDNKLNNESQDFALIFFYSRTCEYCVEQSQILKAFKTKHHWDIRPVSKESSSEMFAKFGVSMTPSVMLIGKKMEKSMMISTGSIALDDLEKRVYRTIRLQNGEITPEQFFMYEFEDNGSLDPTAPLKE